MRLRTILDSIDAGAIALPEFQRGYVWNRVQVRGLVDSVYRGHPVGSLLTWQTQTEGAPARGDGPLSPGVVQLLLDGQQRITSLYGIVRGAPPPFFDGNARAFTDLRFHLDDQTFEFWQPVKMRDDPLWIDVSALLRDGPGAMIGEVYARAGGDAEQLARAAARTERLNRIGQIPERDFHIELVTGEDKGVDVVVDIFNRVNSGGTKLSKGDLALAKICVEWPAAREELKARLRKWERRGYSFSMDWLLRCVSAVVTGRAPLASLADCGPEAIEDGLKRSERAVDKLLNAIASRLGLDHGHVLPGVYAFPVMVRYISDRDFEFVDGRERDRLLYWYVQASMWGRFAGSTETVLAQDLLAATGGGSDVVSRLLDNLRGQRGDLEVRPDDFGGWSTGARFYKILYMLTRVHGARDWGTGDRLDAHALGRGTDLELHHIFPKHRLYEAGYSRRQVNAVANFTFLTLETNRAISDTHPAQYMPTYAQRHPGSLESHWMPMDAQLRDLDRYEEFLEERRRLLAAAANDFFARLQHGDDAETVAEIDVLAAADHSEVIVEESESEILDATSTWVVHQGFAEGQRDFELVDEAGRLQAVLDLAWPLGLQRELSEPVALLIDEPSEVFAQTVEKGYRPFTSVAAFKTYVLSLAEEGIETDREAAEPAVTTYP